MPSVKRVTQPPTPIVSSPAPPEFPPTTEDQFSAHPPPLRASDDYPDLRLLEEFNASQSFDDIFRDVLFGDVPAVSGNLDDATTLEQAVVNPGLDLVANQRIVTPDIDPSAEKVPFNLDLYGATGHKTGKPGHSRPRIRQATSVHQAYRRQCCHVA